MRVAVTGATGFIGRHVVERLVSQGHDVRAIVRPRPVVSSIAGATSVASPLEHSSLVEAFREATVVVHLAGIVNTVDDAEYFEVNAEGTRAVATAARATGARLVHISSLSVAGPATAEAPSTEDDEPNPITTYGRSKLESERVVRSVPGLAWTILRPTIVYGPGDRALLPLFKWARLGVLPLVGRDDAAYTFVHVDDVARAIDASLDGRALEQLIYIGHSEIVTTIDLLHAVQTTMRRRAAIVRIPHPIAWAAAQVGEAGGRFLGRRLALNRSRLREMRQSGFVCRVDRMQTLLGVAANIRLQDGLASTAAWYKKENWL